MKTVLLLLLLSPVVGWAQTARITPADLQRNRSYLLMRDGTVLKGQILRQDSTLISVRRRGGDLSFVEADQVVRIMANRPEEYSSNVPVDVVLARPVSVNRVFVLKDGSRVEGQFVRRDSTMITVRKTNGQLTYFEPELLVRMDSVLAEPFGELDRTFPNRFSPWLLTGLTAHNPEKGRFYYRNTGLLLNELQYGITRFWSVGATFITPIPYLMESDAYVDSGLYRLNSLNSPRLFTKLSASIGNRFRLGIDASYRSSQPFTLSRGWDIWTFQALTSIGSSQRNVTVGYGLITPSRRYYVYSLTPSYSSTRPQTITIYVPTYSFLKLGITQKLSPGLTFISDNTLYLGRNYYYTDESKASVSAALRIDRRRHAFDLGAYALIYQKPRLWENDRRTRFFPYVGYNLLIGRD